ncbi:MAG: hypothetical protein Q9218_003032 [Villophora microphyllina]
MPQSPTGKEGPESSLKEEGLWTWLVTATHAFWELRLYLEYGDYLAVAREKYSTEAMAGFREEVHWEVQWAEVHADMSVSNCPRIEEESRLTLTTSNDRFDGREGLHAALVEAIHAFWEVQLHLEYGDYLAVTYKKYQTKEIDGFLWRVHNEMQWPEVNAEMVEEEKRVRKGRDNGRSESVVPTTMRGIYVDICLVLFCRSFSLVIKHRR